MKIWIYALLFFAPLSLANNADPFNKTNRQTAPNAALTNRASLCNLNQFAIAEHSPFKQLRLIGVLISQESSESLFMNEQQQIFSVKKEEFISEQKLQLIEISKQKVELLQWKANCEKPEKIILKI
ncbi:pilus assembly protein PilP [Pasteurella langaaensis DSM 22999]|uniref:Pilus assembly protein PilP n=1 Tax=Alitibacter langaaensis DSM 22999 TaxID=1122935 RepID=A0A2U0TGR4_9PAST|nr:pilus assembly protein PilP [Pasteurella langaaensis]PVX42724.1 pilus assembly protein PilP [Pasteurella langaaensis DSM 22999]